MKDLFFVDVRNAVMLGKLCSVERLSTAWFAGDGDLKGLKATLFAELILHELDVDSKTALAMPLEATFVAFTFTFVVTALSILAFLHENRTRLRFDIQHDELFPIEATRMQVQRGSLGMDGIILHGDIF